MLVETCFRHKYSWVYVLHTHPEWCSEDPDVFSILDNCLLFGYFSPCIAVVAMQDSKIRTLCRERRDVRIKQVLPITVERACTIYVLKTYNCTASGPTKHSLDTWDTSEESVTNCRYFQEKTLLLRTIIGNPFCRRKRYCLYVI